MYCRYCGKKIDEDSLFCVHCGKQIRDSSNTKVVDDASKTDIRGGGLNSTNKKSRGSISWKRVAIFVIVVVAISVLFIGYKYKPFEKYHTINGHKWVDLGLSVKWATCNVGAAEPSDYGNHFAWGETKTKSKYYWSNSITYGNDVGNILGNPQYDVARANWGGTWRLPTKEEIDELITKCSFKWTMQNWQEGYKVIGPNGNSIFLSTEETGFTNFRGGFWSCTSDNIDYISAYCLKLSEKDVVLEEHSRGDALAVRPVTK